jgi:hypothetical protein
MNFIRGMQMRRMSLVMLKVFAPRNPIFNPRDRVADVTVQALPEVRPRPLVLLEEKSASPRVVLPGIQEHA